MRTKTTLFLLFFALFSLKSAAQPNPNRVPFSIDELEKRTFDFFWQLADPMAQTPDRWPTMQFSSIAATGFGLTSYCIGVRRGYVSRADAAARTRRCLEILKGLPQGSGAAGVAGFRGFFYHFLNHSDALRYQNIELSTIDTVWLMAGILSAQAFFDLENADEKAIRELADFLFKRVEWDWAADENGILSMGWHPEKAFKNGPLDEKSGFLEARWTGYNEAAMLHILALGSPTHSVKNAWENWSKPYLWGQFEGQEMVNFAPLFGHQWSAMYVDFRGIRDDFMQKKGLDYFENARRATLANRSHCAKNAAGWADYSDKVWGLTACDGPGRTGFFNGKKVDFEGYSARGAALDYVSDDGTISPCAAGGSLPFLPAECLTALKTMWEKYPTDSLVGKYGFKDAFNPSARWFDVDYLGIDQGAILLQLENYRSDFVWNLMKKSPVVRAGLEKAGFRGGWLAGHERPERLFSKEIFRDKTGAEMPFRKLDPPRLETQKTSKKYPLVIFLHGSGERGFENETPLKNGVLAFAEPDFRRKWPCHVVVPQCPEENSWATFSHRNGSVFSKTPTEPMRLLIELIEKMRLDPTVDLTKIYVVGLSMGGFGTFELAYRRPDWFAAAMPVCSGAPIDFAEKLKDLPLWIFHGEQDVAVPVEFSRGIFEALKKEKSKAKYTEYATLNHWIWQEVFYSERHLEWLFLQKKGRR